jgi:hypothetical protein
MRWDSLNLAALEGLQDGDVEPLIELLEKSGCEIHPELRLWLAMMLKGDTQARWWLELKKHPGFQKGADDWDRAERSIKIGRRIHELWHGWPTIAQAKALEGKESELQPRTVDEAKSLAGEEWGFRARTIDSAWARYRTLYFRMKKEGSSLSSDLRPLRRQMPKT